MTGMKTIFLMGVTAACLGATMAARADGQSDKGTGTLGAQTAKAVKDGTQNNTSPPSIPNSDTNYFDDKLMWTVDISAVIPKSDNTVDTLCIPSFTTLIGHSPKFSSVPVKDSSGNTSSQTLLPVVLDPSEEPQAAKACARDKTGMPLLFDTSGKPLVDKNTNAKFGWGYNPDTKKYDVEVPVADDVEDALPPSKLAYLTPDVAASADSRKGFDFGALAVPFKVQMTGKQAFTTSASLGAYVGYRFPLCRTGLTISPILFAGASNISTQVTKGSKTTSQTDAALSYGAGFVTTVKDSIQVGLVVGFDHVDSAQPYAYNDKPWLSLEVGYSFAQ